jgi:hypothetical protein
MATMAAADMRLVLRTGPRRQCAQEFCAVTFLRSKFQICAALRAIFLRAVLRTYLPGARAGRRSMRASLVSALSRRFSSSAVSRASSTQKS